MHGGDQPPQYPTPGGPPPQDYKGMSYGNPTEMGNRPTAGAANPAQVGDRPTTGAPVGEQGYQQRQDADQARP